MPLRNLSRILILSVVFLTIGFYSSINDKNDSKVLIKENHTLEMKQPLPQDNQTAASKMSLDKPKEGLALLIGQDDTNLEKQLGAPERIDESLYG